MNGSVLSELSVIIPVGPKETAWYTLLSQLATLPKEAEIILVGVQEEPSLLRSMIGHIALAQTIRWIKSKPGRAYQLNTGVKAAKSNFFWFLHADSQIDAPAFKSLERSLHENPEALHYFNLKFLDDGPIGTRINNIGVWIRSHWMGLPFGDQGFCLSRKTFELLGGYLEDAPYGEDHLLVWAAHHNGVPLKCTGAILFTSARKYKEHGWMKNTLVTMVLTAKQAFPEVMKIFKKQKRYESE